MEVTGIASCAQGYFIASRIPPGAGGSIARNHSLVIFAAGMNEVHRATRRPQTAPRASKCIPQVPKGRPETRKGSPEDFPNGIIVALMGPKAPKTAPGLRKNILFGSALGPPSGYVRSFWATRFMAFCVCFIWAQLFSKIGALCGQRHALWHPFGRFLH